MNLAFCLYTTTETSTCANLAGDIELILVRICSRTEVPSSAFTLEIVPLFDGNRERAAADGVFRVPALVLTTSNKKPQVVGDLSNLNYVENKLREILRST